MAQGFGKSAPGKSLSGASQILFGTARQIGSPLVMPMFGPGNSRGLKPGQLQAGRSELPPDCDGVVIGVACSADDAQALIDLVMNWQRGRLARESDRRG